MIGGLAISKLVRESLCTVLRTSPFKAMRESKSGAGTILMYHSISEAESSSPNSILKVSPQNFEQQIAYLKNHYDVIPLNTLLDRLQSGKSSRDCVAITFDDGYRDNFTAALPILEKYTAPATIFLTTAFLDKSHYPWWDALERILASSNSSSQFYQHASLLKSKSYLEQQEILGRLSAELNLKGCPSPQMLSWDEAKILSEHPLITIGAHTLTHPSLAGLELPQVKSELLQSKTILEQRLGVSIKFFAYPYGTRADATPREFKIAEEVGFQAAFSTEEQHLSEFSKMNAFALPRFSVDGRYSIADFEDLLSGVKGLLRL